MTEKLGKKIRRAMQEAGLSQVKLAKQLGVTQAAVSKWLLGITAPTIEMLKKIAVATSKPLNHFFEDTMADDGAGKQTERLTDVYAVLATRVPLLGTINANSFNCHFVDEEPTIFLSTAKGQEGDFSLKVAGDCMEPEIKDGDIIILRPVAFAEVREGDIVIAKLKGGEECTLKRYFTQGNKIWLVPDNDKYKPISGTVNEVEISAKMIDRHAPPKRKKRPDFLDK